MVWLHGSAFGATRRGASATTWLFTDGTSGQGVTSGRQLARQGAVVVSINYRVGFLGYLATDSLSAESPDGTSGNYALHDQLAALRWVQQNIARFGGDPDRVTLFGQGTGARLASLLMTSPSARGLFHRVILQSPGPMVPLERLGTAESAAASFEPTSLRDFWTVETIRRLDEQLSRRRFAPIVDGQLLPLDDVRAFAEGHFHAVPMMIGTVADEGSLYGAVASANALSGFRQWREQTFGNLPDTPSDIVPDPPASPSDATAAALMHAFGDVYVTHGVRRIALASAARQPKTFRYVFARSLVVTGHPPRHGEELGYVFGNLSEITLFSAMAPLSEGTRRRRLVGNPIDEALSEAMMAAWVRFAATGDPNGGDLPAWPPYTQTNEAILAFGDNIRLGREERAPALDAVERAFHSLQERESTRIRERP